MTYNIEILLEKNEKFSDFLGDQLREFNNSHSFHHREARKEGAVKPINIIVTGDNHEYVGGLAAEVYWNWLEIKKFWISDEFRGQGIGTSLLKMAEEIALQKGAVKVLLTTYEYQGRTFYEQYGYYIVGEIKDYPPGSSFYTMVKELAC